MGWSSPIVWHGHIVLTSALSAGKEKPPVHDARTGKQIYGRRRISADTSDFTTSPWAYNGRVFLLSEDGDTFVVQAGPEFKVLGKNSLSEMPLATPAVLRGSLIVHTQSLSDREGGAEMIRATIFSRIVVLSCWATMLAGAWAPAAAQSVTLSQVGAIPGSAELVRVQDRRAYVGSGKTLTIWDLSNPVAPKRAGSYSFPEKIWGFRVIGSTAYVAADFFGLGLLDVSNVAAPVLRGSFKTPGQAKNVAIYGTKVLVADHMSGVDYIDVSNPAKPASLGSFFLDGYAKDVIAVGPMAYAVDAPAGLYVLDLAKEGPLEQVGTAQSAAAPGFIEIADTPAGSPKLAYLVGGGMLQVYDVSSPTTIAKVSALRIPGRATRAAVKGTTVYIATGAEGIQIVDLSTPATPKIVGAYKTLGPARDVAVTDAYVFVAIAAGEDMGQVLILRQTP